MADTLVVAPAASGTTTTAPTGLRKNGKNWHPPKKAFRPTAGQTSFAKRMEIDQVKKATKAREQEMKDEKEQERNRRIQAIKDKRKAKEEKERYAKMEEKMHRKLVERRRRREKRNKLLNS
ncbi:rRNA-processing protein cgr1 [Neophaeococcomyces mojaviensis]|uniref:rRNA-processing protein cgr1 n=1 Tax=Neophaeococcomyces mojaviensis TaxID=3383035 RepID=A0ACC3AA94_9EURO|nr:rRNA-processing protein cgr1 [Knufia sp. JES_112]